MRRIVAKREQIFFVHDHNVAFYNILFQIKSSSSNSKSMQEVRYVGYNVPLTVHKFVNNVVPGTCFNRQRKQNNSPLSVDG